MVGLAALLAEGRGISRDESGAVKWLTRAAELGSLHAQYNLANMLFSGRGCQKESLTLTLILILTLEP